MFDVFRERVHDFEVVENELVHIWKWVWSSWVTGSAPARIFHRCVERGERVEFMGRVTAETGREAIATVQAAGAPITIV